MVLLSIVVGTCFPLYEAFEILGRKKRNELVVQKGFSAEKITLFYFYPKNSSGEQRTDGQRAAHWNQLPIFRKTCNFPVAGNILIGRQILCKWAAAQLCLDGFFMNAWLCCQLTLCCMLKELALFIISF